MPIFPIRFEPWLCGCVALHCVCPFIWISISSYTDGFGCRVAVQLRRTSCHGTRSGRSMPVPAPEIHLCASPVLFFTVCCWSHADVLDGGGDEPSLGQGPPWTLDLATFPPNAEPSSIPRRGRNHRASSPLPSAAPRRAPDNPRPATLAIPAEDLPPPLFPSSARTRPSSPPSLGFLSS